MRNQKLMVISLAFGLAVAAPFTAWASQAGGLPALAKKVRDLQGQNNWAVVAGDTGNIVRQFSSAGPVSRILMLLAPGYTLSPSARTSPAVRLWQPSAQLARMPRLSA